MTTPPLTQHETVVKNINPLPKVLSKLGWESSNVMDDALRVCAGTMLPIDLDNDNHDDMCSSGSTQFCSKPDSIGKGEPSREASFIRPLVFAATSESCNLRKAILVGMYYSPYMFVCCPLKKGMPVATCIKQSC